MAFLKQYILATLFVLAANILSATPFTQQVPGTNLTIPDDYPEAGGVVVVLIGVNGNSYFQFSNPTGAFVGFNNTGTPTEFRGNPFTINDPIQLDCGFSTCTSYFGGAIAEAHIRFTAFDGDTQAGGFDEDDIDLLLNGFNVGNWSDIPTQNTSTDGTQLISSGVGFGNRTFDTGWFNSTNPALLSNILTTNQTGSQVLDDDPNDNFWNFSLGNTLTNPAIVTVAPGYSLEKTADKTDFTVVGEEIDYEYLITNIGSVPISQLAVSDDRISNVVCTDTTIVATTFGGTPDTALCTGTYTVTQEDIDIGSVTNIASATGIPAFGTLGELTDTVTVNGPTREAELSLVKETALSEFGAVGTTVPYSFVATNTGNVTLENVTVTDPLIPSLSCSVASLLPLGELTCSGNYTVQQSDIDNFASDGTLLSNTATVTATALVGPVTPATDNVAIPGSTPTLTMDFTKAATTADYDAVGEVIQYEFTITNTGTVSFPDAPVITDVLTGGATCPSGSVAPNASITCLASYTIEQSDIDNGAVDNSATATITVGSLTADGADTANVPAVRTTTMTLDKRLNASSPTSFNAPGVDLTYDYVLTNTGNVTLNTPLITDDRTTATCTDASIAPGAQITCTSANYTTIQADVNRLGVTNIASATATAAGPTPATVTSNTDEVTVPSILEPEITLVKTAPPVSAADFQVGNVITYTYEVTNTGNVRLRNIIGVSEIRVDDSRFPASFLCFDAPLNLNATQSCTQDYVLTIDDINAGVVQNTATASAQGSALVGLIESAEVQVTVAPVLTPALSLVKTADVATVSEATDTITYTFSVTNSGDTQIVSPIQINDAKLLTPADCSAQPSPFNVGESFDCTATYNPTQAELDAGQVDNAATASFEFTQNGATATIASDQDDVSVDVVQNPLYTFEKTASPTTFSSVGETITYTFAVENTGNVTFTEISVTDPLIPNLSCTLTDIAPDGTSSCTGTYVVTQADLDAEVVDNEATAAGSTAAGAGLTLLSDVSVPAAPGVATMIASIEKTADRATFAAVGEVIEYTLAVTNDGTQTLTDLAVTDSLDTTFSCEVPRLLPAETSSICTFSHTVTQADFDAGQVDNTATVASPDITTANSQLVSVTGPIRTSSFTLEKTASNDFTQANDIVNFTFAVSNTGNTALTNVVVVDSDVTPALNCTIPSLLPGVTDSTSCSVAYTVTQADVDAGQFTNTADATAIAPTGVTAPAAQSSTAIVDGPAENAAVQIVKSSTDGVYTSATDSEVFTFEVTNTGNVTLTGLSVSDANLGGLICPIDDLVPGAVATTCSDGTALTATKNFTQFDVDAASFTNTASVAGQSAVLGTAVSDDDTVTVTGPVQAPALTMVKTETLGTTFDTLGQSVPYTFTVTNAGNTTLTGPITVVDDQIASVICAATPAGGIAPGGTLECTGTHTVVQTDLNLGSITNNATASVTQSVVAQNPGDPTIVTVSSPEVTEMIMAAQSPDLMIDKRVKAGSPTSFSAINADNFITYEYVVTNIGNVTLLEDIVIVDDKFTAANLTCSTADLAPLGTVTCEQTWFADQQALDDGFVTNVATADTTFVDKDGVSIAVQSQSDTVTVTAVQDPSLALVKTIVAPVPLTFTASDTLSYEFLVTNNGNVTIEGPISITDSLLLTPADCGPSGANDLAPSQSITCEAEYDITSNDLDLGSTTNVAMAVGSFDGDPVTSPSSSTVFPIDAEPALAIVKSIKPGTPTTFDDLTDTLTYQYVVTNDGLASFTSDINIVDDKAGTFLCRPSGLGDFEPRDPSVVGSTGDTHTCEVIYQVTQDDLDAGFVTNEASATSIFAPLSATPLLVVSPTDTVTVTSTEIPLLVVEKSVTSGPATAEVGDTLEYTIITTNTGNQTISAVAITDPLIPVFTSCTVNGSAAGSNVILSPTAPNNALTCVGNYTVTQADIDAQDAVDTGAQGLPNTATVAGSDPQGVAVGASVTNIHPLIEPLAAVTVSKDLEAFPGPEDDFSAVGQEITFNISVTNSGEVTLTDTVVTDSLTVVPQTCTIGSLAPGETDTSCVVVYTVTQADFDTAFGTDGTIGRAGVLNTATATSQPATPNSIVVTAEDDAFAAGPERIEEFTLGKSSTTDEITSVGQIVTYTYVVANSGNVTLTAQPVVEDDRITGAFNCGTIPVGGLLPQETVTCTQPYAVTQADLDLGSVTNIASVTSAEVLTPATATLTIDAAQAPALSITKTPSPTANVEVGEVVTYTYTVTNAGNVTITDVTVTDQHTSSAGTAALTVAGDTLLSDINEAGTSIDAAANGVWDTLGSGDVVTFTATYTVTQDDVDQQVTLTNVASVTGVDPNAQNLPAQTANASVTVVAQAPSFTVSKTGNAALSDPVALGDVVTFEITVANTGNQTLTGVAPTDTLTTNNTASDALTVTALVLDRGDTDQDGELDVGETHVYQTTYVVEQVGLDAGSISNTVSVTRTDPQGVPITEVLPTPVVIDFSQAPALEVVKTATPNLSDPVVVGDTIDFTITVANTGNVTLSAIELVDTLTDENGEALDLTSGPTLSTGDLDNDSELDVGETWTYLASFTLDQQAIDAGGVSNTATATGTLPQGGTVSDVSNADVPDGDTPTDVTIPRNPVVSLLKSAVLDDGGDGIADAGDTITYTFTVSNDGNVTLFDAVVSDTEFTGTNGAPTLTRVSGGTAINEGTVLDIAVDAAPIVYTAVYTLSQDDVDAGDVTNQASVSINDPDGTALTDLSDPADVAGDEATVVSFASVPGLEVVKTGTPSFSDPVAVGDAIAFTITVANTGNVTLSDIDLSDDLTDADGEDLVLTVLPTFDSGDLDNDNELDVGETWTYLASFTLDQQAIDAGGVSNTATATGTLPQGGTISDVSNADAPDGDTPTEVTIPRAPAIAVVKAATVNAGSDGVVNAGDVVSYTYAVTNEGNVTLFDVGVTETTFTGSDPAPTPTLLIGGSDEGGDASILDLPVGTGTLVFTATYNLTQADVDAGGIDNQATASADDPAGNVISDLSDDDSVTGDDLTSIVIDPIASMDVVKTVNTSGLSNPVQAGDTLVYTVTVENTGNVTLDNVVPADTFTRRDGTPLALTLSGPAGDTGLTADALDATETWSFTASYTLLQEDVDAGGVDNTVTVTAESPTDVVVTDTSDDGDDTDGNTADDPTEVRFEAVPELDLVKSLKLSEPLTYQTLNEEVEFEFEVTNTGNVTITAQVVIDDPLITQAGGLVSCEPSPIAVGDSVLCSGSYLVTQADLDNGSFENLATATVNQPVVPFVDGGATNVEVESEEADITVPATQLPAITIAKAVKAGSPLTYSQPGDTTIFEYTITNVGNVTLTSSISVFDDQIPGILDCGGTGLAPLGMVTCEQTWTADLQDLNDGFVTNTGTAQTTFNNQVVSEEEPATATVTAIQEPSLAIVKTLTSAVPNQFDVGTVLSYSFLITNDGNVTIDGTFTVEDNLSTVNCTGAPTSLDPLETATCTSTYSIRSVDLDLGSTLNVATASGSFDGAAVTSPSDDEIFPVGAVPALSLTKDSVPTDVTFAELGDTIVYTYTITNTGGVGFNTDIMIADNRFEDPIACYVDTPTDTLSIGETQTCTAVYDVTQDDLDAGFVTNEAVASTTFAPGTDNETLVLSPAQEKTVPAVEDPELTVLKSVTAGPSPAMVDDILTYTLTAENTGNQTISGVTLVDPLIPALTCTVAGVAAGTNVVLLPDDVLICVGTYTVLQTDVDAQTLVNTATATGSDPQGETITTTGTNSHPLDIPEPLLLVTKSVQGAPVSGAVFSAKDETVTFIITVENQGNVTLNNLNISDSLSVTPATCSVASLAPGASNSSCIVSYVTTQADVDALNTVGGVTVGGFTNTATATALPATPNAATLTETGDVFVQGPDRAPAFSILKAANVSNVVAFGDVVSYTYTVTNSGNVTLVDQPVVIDDRIANVNCAPIPLTGLAPLETLVCSADYTVTQADIDSGDVTNIASVSSAEVPLPTVPGDAQTSLTVPVIQTPGVSLVKEVVGDPDVAEGDTIIYLYTVENTGNVTLTDVTVGDQHTSASGTVALTVGADTLLTDLLEQNNSTDSGADGVWDTLGPNDVVTFEATYVVTQGDIDAQNDLSNTATVTTTAPDGVVAPTDTQTVDLPVEVAEPELTAVKTADVTALSSPPIAGEIVTFEITVENTGNQTLDTVTLVDTLRRADGTPLMLTTQPVLTGGDAGIVGDLEVGEIWTFEATYALTQDDVDGGGITNSVLARAQSPNDTPVTDLSDNGIDGDGVDNPTLVQIPAAPSIVGVKTITSTTIALGETVTFAITAENTGNVTLRNVAVASDTLTRADGTVLALTSNPIFISSTASSGAGVLLPDEIATYTATYVLTQDDIDAGGISNSAVVAGTPPVGSAVTDITDDNDPADGNQTADLIVPSAPQLSLVKRLPSGASPTFSAVGEIITYEFEVTNAGNITLDGPFSINDPLITDAGGEITCEAGPIAPGGSVICTGEYAVVQEDIDVGSRLNTATATDGSTTSPEASLTVPALQLPAMEVVKVAQAVPAATFIPGLEVTYTYTVTNIGNTTFENPITINDNLIDAANITCPEYPVEGVAPTQTYVCTGIYTVTADDVDLGSVTNLATATDGETTSALVSETIPDEGTPALDIEKTAETDAIFAEVGDEIVYNFAVTNAGTRAFVRDVVVMDDRLGAITCFAPTPEVSAFVSGDVVTCSATDTVTQADLDAGFVTNEAFAQTIFGLDDTPTSSAPVSETVDAALAPQITLAKSSTPNPVSVVGETLTYTLVATNEGNQTLTNVSVLDPLLPNLSCTIPELLRGETLTCDDTYIVTQDDIDRGVLVNTATVNALTPQGTSVSATGSETTVMPASAPSMTLAKVASPSPFGEVGSTLTYVFTVANTGNTTLSDITVTDVMDPEFACTISSIAPLSSDTTCSYSTIVTQEQVDAGEIVNTATAVGSDPFDTAVDAEAEITTPGPEQIPGLNVTKVALPSASALGSTVTFQLTVVNTGNVSLTPQVPVDSMERLDGTIVTLDAPFALISGDTDNDGLIDVTETWIYSASRVLVQGDLNAGGLRNSASLTATAPNGTSTTDVSDNGVDSDGNVADDPTVFLIVQEPQLTVTKSVVAESTALGGIVTFTIEALNSGNVDVGNLSITDTLRRFDGSEVTGVTIAPVDVPTLLSPGGIATWQVVHVVTQEDVDAGGLSNTATVSGTDPSGSGLSDVSADDDLADGNVEDDPTELLFPPAPGLEVIKTVASVGTAVGEDVVFNITVENTGNVTLTDVEIVDTMTNLAGDSVEPVTIEFIEADGAPASEVGTLQAGETATYTVTYTLELADVDSGGLENTATATGMTLLGATVSDVSNNEAQAGDTPTIALIDAAPSLEVVKTASEVAVLFPTVEQVTFTIQVTNTGNVTQTGLQVVDDLTIYSSPATLLLAEHPTRVTITDFVDGTANTAYDGVSNINTLAGNPTLAPGETGTVVIVSTYSSAAGFPANDNTATATSDQLPAGETGTSTLSLVDADGDGVLDSLEGNGDRDGDGISDSQDFDPTGYFYCESDGRILSGGMVSVSGNGFTQTGVGTTGPITIVQDGNSGFFQFFSTAAGTFTMNLTYPPIGVPSTTRTDLGTLDATTLLPANPASLGSNEFGSTGVLADFTAAANPFYTVFDLEAGDPFILNNNIPVTNCETVPNVLASKTADRTLAVIGETVNYTLSFVNNTSQTFTNATFVDQLPAGMLFTPGSSAVDSVATAPVVNGRRLEFGGLTIVPAQTISVTLSARVVAGAAFGALTNQAWLEDSTGTRQSNIATATVELQPEPVFDCSDVIGKVYDDINRNSYQDDGEPGLPSVRIVSTDGTIIRTDEFGRYSVPCAALPKDIGSNFTLKVDTRTLPTGYRITTENPRVERLTAGKFAKINFGAALSNVVDIDLTAKAFKVGSVSPSDALDRAIDGLLERIEAKPSSLRLSYVMQGGEEIAGARARLRAVEDMVRKKWRGRGRYKLLIERTVKRLKAGE